MLLAMSSSICNHDFCDILLHILCNSIMIPLDHMFCIRKYPIDVISTGPCKWTCVVTAQYIQQWLIRWWAGWKDHCITEICITIGHLLNNIQKIFSGLIYSRWHSQHERRLSLAQSNYFKYDWCNDDAISLNHSLFGESKIRNNWINT